MNNSPDNGVSLRQVGGTHLLELNHADWDARRAAIKEYQERFECSLVILIDSLDPARVTLFEETLAGADLRHDLHILLDTSGGYADTAIRFLRQARARCQQLTVVVPNQAKSEGTLFALGADHIIMGPTSDLGPVDPQTRLEDRDGNYPFEAAKTIIEAARYAADAVQERPETHPLHASLLGNLSAVQVQAARDALDHARAQLHTVLGTRLDLAENSKRLHDLALRLEAELIDNPRSHGASVSAKDALALGLPVRELGPSDPQWQLIWQLWTRYWALRAESVYESERTTIVYA